MHPSTIPPTYGVRHFKPCPLKTCPVCHPFPHEYGNLWVSCSDLYAVINHYRKVTNIDYTDINQLDFMSKYVYQGQGKVAFYFPYHDSVSSIATPALVTNPWQYQPFDRDAKIYLSRLSYNLEDLRLQYVPANWAALAVEAATRGEMYRPQEEQPQRRRRFTFGFGRLFTPAA